MKTVAILFALLMMTGAGLSQYRVKTPYEIQQERRQESEQKRQRALDKKAEEKATTAKLKAAETGIAERFKQIQDENMVLAKKMYRLEHLCENAGIDMAMVYNDSLWPDVSFGKIEIGKMAYIRTPDTLKVVQIIDDKNFIGSLSVHYERYTEREGLVSGHNPPVTIWVKGIQTTGMVDDRSLPINVTTPMKVTGTTQYSTTIGGSSTVFVLEPAGLPKVQFIKK